MIKVSRKAKQALKESIVDWEEKHVVIVLHLDELFKECSYNDAAIVFGDGETVAHGIEDCYLCKEYFCRWHDCDIDCPIEASGDGCGAGSKYEKYDDYVEKNKSITQNMVFAHLSMINFMKDLYRECEVEEVKSE